MASNYRIRLLGSLAFILLVLLLAVRFSPVGPTPPRHQTRPPTLPEPPLLEVIAVTRQTLPPSAPDRPAIAPTPPKDRVLEDPLLLPDDLLQIPLPQLPTYGSGADGRELDPIVGNPSRPPAPTRIVEPGLEGLLADADRSRIRVRVGFVVDREGRVQEVEVVSVERRSDGGRFEPWDGLPATVREEVVRSATQWRFRPAAHENRPVRAYWVDTFRF